MVRAGSWTRVLWWDSWSGRTLCDVLVLVNQHSYRDNYSWSVFMAGLLKAALEGAKKDGKKAKTLDKDVSQVAPTLHAFLTQGEDDDGKERQVSTLLVFAEEGVWKACLSERDHDLTLWASAETFWGLLEALEGRLTESPVEWRKKKPYGQQGGKKKG